MNCTVHGVELVFFSWDIPNREVSRSGAEQALLFSFPFLITFRPHDRAQIESRCRDTPHFLSPCEILLTTCGVGIAIIDSSWVQVMNRYENLHTESDFKRQLFFIFMPAWVNFPCDLCNRSDIWQHISACGKKREYAFPEVKNTSFHEA